MLKKLRSNLRFRLRDGRIVVIKRHSKFNFGNNYSYTTKKDYIRTISKEYGLSASQIRQLVKNKQNEYNFKISYRACLYLIRKDLTNKKEKAPQCNGFSNDGTRCQKRINHPSGHCHHHRLIHYI